MPGGQARSKEPRGRAHSHHETSCAQTPEVLRPPTPRAHLALLVHGPTQRQGRENSAAPVRAHVVVRSGFPPPRAYLRDSRRRATGSPAMDTTSSTAPRTPNGVIRSSRKATDNKVAVSGSAIVPTATPVSEAERRPAKGG